MNPPDVARRTLRQLALAALNTAITNGDFTATIQSPGDWNVSPEQLVANATPLIMVRTPTDQKQSRGKQEPNFQTNVTLELKAFAPAATSDADAQDAAEILDGWLEDTLLRNPALILPTQQVASVETTTEIVAEGEYHFGGVAKRIVLETFEDFEPKTGDAFTEARITVDLKKPFDPTGTYDPSPDAPPYTPTPAPRTIGPDGRVEGDIDITLPQGAAAHDVRHPPRGLANRGPRPWRPNPRRGSQRPRR